MIDTKTATRRELEYASLDELVADAERAVAEGAETTGNWSKGQIFEHIATVIDMTVHGFPFKANFLLRFIGRNFLLPRFLKQGMPTGFKPSKNVAEKVMPDETDDQAALDHLRSAVEELKQLDHNIEHAFFGNLDPDTARAINRRHAELHMSFIKG